MSEKDELIERKLREEKVQEEKARFDEVLRQKLKQALDDPMQQAEQTRSLVKNQKPSSHAPLIPCIRCRKTHRKGECKGA